MVVSENVSGGPGFVGAYDATTGGTINASLVTGLSGGHAINVLGSSMFISNWNASPGNISQYNVNSGATISSPLISGVRQAGGLLISGSSLLASTASNANPAQINEYTTAGSAVAVPFITFASGSMPYGIAEANNILYVALVNSVSTPGQGVIAEYNATTGALIDGSFITGLNIPEGIWLSGNNLYVANNAAFNNLFGGPLTNGTVGEYDATTGAAINASLVSGLNQPADVAVLGNNLYVSTFSNNVGLYDATTGATINANFITGLNDPQGLFVIAPEPPTLALLAIGAGAGLLAAHGIRRQSRRRPLP